MVKMDAKTKKSSSGVYLINYHIVWVTKYRKQVLNTNIQKTLDVILKTICDSKGWTLIELRIMPDHVHISISTTPFEKPVDMVKVLKGVTAKQLFSIHPELRDVLKYGHLWSPSYYVGTAGNVSAEIIEKYIREQQHKDNRYKDGGHTSPPFKNGGFRV